MMMGRLGVGLKTRIQLGWDYLFICLLWVRTDCDSSVVLAKVWNWLWLCHMLGLCGTGRFVGGLIP